MLLVSAGLLASAPALALTANELFEDGNRLYRSDLYWAALLRYKQAGEQGMASPVLDYNMGVAHYRAKQHVRAREYLLRALDSPSLEVATQYNLGLNAWELGQADEALRWLRLARDQTQSRKISRYARVAIARILTQRGDVELEEDEVFRRVEPKYTRLELRADVGFGTDSNVFRAPADPYRDRAQENNPVVRPEEFSGAFVPFSLSLKYDVSPYTNEGFYGAYRLAGRSYQDTEINDADQYAHEVSFGSAFSSFNEEKGRTRELTSAFTVAQHEEFYVDPDTGRYFLTPDGDDVHERMDYLRYGPQIAFRQSYERFAFGASAKGQLWNYTDTEFVPEYDHEYFDFGAFAQYRFTDSSLVRFRLGKSSRRFGDRPAFNLDGEQLDTNPSVRYDYLDLGLTARQRITDNMWFGVSYERRERTDKFEGYNDYTVDSYGGHAYWQIGYRFKIDAGGVYELYNFPRAFPYNDNTLVRKTLELARAELTASYRLTRRMYVVLEGNYTKKVSNDVRIGYERTQYMISVRWFH